MIRNAALVGACVLAALAPLVASAGAAQRGAGSRCGPHAVSIHCAKRRGGLSALCAGSARPARCAAQAEHAARTHRRRIARLRAARRACAQYSNSAARHACLRRHLPPRAPPRHD